jgi:hypothetical protein
MSDETMFQDAGAASAPSQTSSAAAGGVLHREGGEAPEAARAVAPAGAAPIAGADEPPPFGGGVHAR